MPTYIYFHMCFFSTPIRNTWEIYLFVGKNTFTYSHILLVITGTIPT